ncbi:MAG: lytic transglycosylase domain-containing protein [Deltaproteobacteria bacterium]|jgi:soluble lytic murein transglycosylase-like protein|nr:lytic transglycosylase domain-containing protein [Deltaproteobacteria bacterium]
MSAFSIHKFFRELRVRAVLVTAAAGLAVVPVAQEHQARTAYARAAEAPRPAQAMKVKARTRPAIQLASTLRPDPALLEMVKTRAVERPTFDKKASGFDEIIVTVARENGVSPALVKAVIQAESRFNSRAVSANGAVGLMQILPATARSVGVRNLERPRDNITAGVRYLRSLLDQFGDDEILALAAYNCGPEKIRRYGNIIPPITETRSFVSQVMEYYQSYIQET